MNNFGKQALGVMAVALALGVSSTASAQSAKEWTFALGLKKITPKVDSGFLTAPTQPGVKNDVLPDTKPALTVGYMLTDHIGVETFLAPPFKHDQIGTGSLQGTGKLGSVESLPVTLLLQYVFLEPKNTFRPRVAAGITYGYFQKATGSAQLTALSNPGGPPTTFKVDNAWGTTFELGLTVNFNDKWFGDINVAKSYLKTTSHFSTGQRIDVKLDPVTTGIAIGYRF